jgi:hypothetical protein
VVDLNNALVAYILTEYAGFTSAAGHVGPLYRVDHDISMLVPEIWCRMRVAERDPKFLIENGYLEKVGDFEFEGRAVLASRLGYRITALFVDHFLGRIFEVPDTVFPEELLRPEQQDMAVFAAGVDAIVEAQRRVALHYFEDGSVEAACPPLRALLEIMTEGSSQGMTIDDPGLRAMFTREAMIGSDWYLERLRVKQQRDIALWRRHMAALKAFRSSGMPARHVDIEERLETTQFQLDRVSAASYVNELVGTIGADPLHGQMPHEARTGLT